jgi:hypothetical protein
LTTLFARTGFCLALLALGCEDKGRISAERAKEHAATLVKTAKEDLREVRMGLPAGSQHLARLFSGGKRAADDPKAAEDALENARNRVQDLRTAKSTFFAVVDENGLIIRNDNEEDAMAGKNLFAAYPELKAALSGKLVEAQGSMPEASGVKGRKDAQWVAAAPINVDGVAKGLYATGWSWSSYAYRLENSIRTQLRSGLKEHDKLPLVYVFVVANGAVYAAPMSPDVSMKEIEKLKVLEQVKGEQPFIAELQITGREFGLAARALPDFGPNVALVVLRTET